MFNIRESAFKGKKKISIVIVATIVCIILSIGVVFLIKYVSKVRSDKEIKGIISEFIEEIQAGDLENAITYTNLDLGDASSFDEHLVNLAIEHYSESDNAIKSFIGSSVLNKLVPYVFERLHKQSDYIAFRQDLDKRLIEDYEIKEVSADGENALVSISITSADWQYVWDNPDYIALISNGLDIFSFLKNIKDSIKDGLTQGFLNGVADLANPLINSFFEPNHKAINDAPDAEYEIAFRLYREKDRWIIDVGEITQELRDYVGNMIFGAYFYEDNKKENPYYSGYDKETESESIIDTE